MKIHLLLPYIVASHWQLATAAHTFPIVRDSRYGFTTREGDVLVRPSYEAALGFSQNIAAVKVGSKWGFLGTNATLIVPARFESAQSFSEGFAAVKQAGKWGYIDTAGNERISFQFKSATEFSEGIAGVRRDDGWVFISTTGEQALHGVFDAIGSFSGGLAPAMRDGQWFFINKTGDVAIPTSFHAALQFSGGFAAVSDRASRKYGFIRRDGKFAIPPRFDAAKSFSEGCAAVQLDDRWGYVSAEGKMVIEPQYMSAQTFKDGLAEVTDPSFGRSFYIDIRGVVALTKNTSAEPGKFAGYSFVTNTVDSTPENAAVFFIPQPDWKRIPPVNRTNVIYQANGRTKLQTASLRMPFMILGRLPDGRQAVEPFNPMTATTNYIHLNDFR